MKKLSVAALVVAAVMILAGCNLMQVNPERDENLVVAVVNGQQILKKDVNTQVGFDYNTNYTADQLSEMITNRETAMENLISDALVLQKAKEEGMYEFTEEEQAEIQSNFDEAVTSIYDPALEKYQEQKDDGQDIDPVAKANEDVDSYLLALGTSREEVMQNYTDSEAAQKLYDSVTASATVADEDVQSAYASLAAQQESTYATTPTQVISDMMNGSVICYMPDGVIKVRQILIAIDSATSQEISTLRSDGDTDGANAKLFEALAGIQDKADEVLAKVTAGEDFDALIAEYNDDPGMDSYPDGYPTMDGYTGYMTNFQEAALALQNVGDTSGLVYTDAGYHILKLTAKMQGGAVALEDVQDAVKEQLLNQAKSTLWSSTLSEWSDAATIKRYTSRLR